MPWPVALGLVVASYLLGGVPFALLLGFARGVDIRHLGSGNVGATNLGRALGRSWAIAAFALDFAKGLAPVLVSRLVSPDDAEGGTRRLVEVAVGVAAVAGHVASPYLGFRGGKGVATTFGVMTALTWIASAAAGGVWLALFFTTRVVSLASLASAATFPLAVAWLERASPFADSWPLFAAASGLAALIVIRHRSNIARLLRREENSLDRRPKDRPPGELATGSGPSPDARRDSERER